MSRNCSVHPQARRDLEDCAAFIAKDNPAAAFRLMGAAEATYQNLALFPAMGKIYPKSHPTLGSIRFMPIKGFPRYLAFYAIEDGEVNVIRVLHSSRDIGHILNWDLP